MTTRTLTREVGHGIAVAFVATVYGVASANLFFLPAANKLKSRMKDSAVLKELMLEGVIGIVEGLNPTLIRLKLESYIANPGKPAAKAKPAANKAFTPSSTKVMPYVPVQGAIIVSAAFSICE